MMTPEQTIAAFLEVWENNPELFLAEDVKKDLDGLNQALTSSPDAPNADIAKQIQDWCKTHHAIRDAVRSYTRKVKPENNISPQNNSKSLHNQYPQVSQTLRDRLPKIGEGNTPQ